MMRRLFLGILLASLAIGLPLHARDREPIKVLIVTGDHGHQWRQTTPYLQEILTHAGMKVDVTETPARDLTADNLARYDVFVLNYKDTKSGRPETRWSEANQQAFAQAVRDGKGLVVYHHASSAFTSGGEFDKEFERLIAGGWRKQGNHGKRHPFTVAIRKPDHPITRGLPETFAHASDELYQNSVMFPENIVLATAYSDKAIDKRNSGKDEPVVWVASYGKGRVVENVLGHDVPAMKDAGFQALFIRCVEWAATGETHYPVPAELKKGAGS
jgi:type 1 glutamine amidotransferase